MLTNDERLQILKDIIQIPSVNGDEAKVAEYIENLLNQHGIDSIRVPYSETRHNLVAELKGSEPGPILAFSGHFDVVDADHAKDWKYDPFSATEENGKLYGRGTADMKMGVAAMIIAMIELKAAGAPFAGAIRFLGTVGEEIGMLGSKQLSEDGYMDDVDALIISEPSSNQIMTAHKGSLQFKVESYGKAAHSSSPHLGYNSLSVMSQFIVEAEARFEEVANEYENEQLGRVSNSFTVINGGTQINTVPAQTTLLGNTRTIPEFDNQRAIDLMEEVIEKINTEKDAKLELIVTQSAEPVEAETDSLLVSAILATTDDPIKITSLAGATDASNLMKNQTETDFAIYGLADFEQAHKLDEHIIIDDFFKSCDLYKEIAINYFEAK